MSCEHQHLDKIRERFTTTAEVFAQSVRSTRMDLAIRVAERATAGLANATESLAIDVACGPGTFARQLAARVRHAIGVDLTPAMVEKARVEAARDAIPNIEFICADVYELPFADGIAGVVSCGYAVHHMTDPARALAEMVRVLRPGGRVAIVDIVLREGSDSAIHDAIERVRDPSHSNTLTVAQFRSLFEGAGLRMRSEELSDYPQEFDDWMKNAARAPGDAVYEQVKAMLERAINPDVSGLRPRRSEKTGGIELVRTVALFVAEKSE